MPSDRPINYNVANQHLEEAAFYWGQRQAGMWSPLFFKDDLERLDRIIVANIRGLSLAGSSMVQLAIDNLDRWQTENEVFVLACLAAATNSPSGRECLENTIPEKAGFVAAAESAFFWSTDKCQSLANQWFNHGSGRIRATSVKPLVAVSQSPLALVDDALEDESSEVQLRAVQLIGERKFRNFQSHVNTFFDHPSAECRAEAAISSLTLSGEEHPKILIDAISEMLGQRKNEFLEPGEWQLPLIRRGVLCWALISDDRSFFNWIDKAIEQPKLTREAIWAIAFRGDIRGLAKLIQLVENNRHPRLAAYAVSHVLGVDLDAEGLSVLDDSGDQDEMEIAPWSSEDDGLPLPNSEIFVDWLKGFLIKQDPVQQMLAGEAIESAVEEMSDLGNQPQRWQAMMCKALGILDR